MTFCRNRPRRPELNFEKILRAVLLIVVVVCRRRCRRRRRRRGRWHGGAVKIRRHPFEDVQACGTVRAKIHPGSRLSFAYKLPPLRRPEPNF